MSGSKQKPSGLGNSMKQHEVVVGIDLGTGGARIVASDRHGTIAASATQQLPEPPPAQGPGYCEQDPSGWWETTAHALRQLVSQLAGSVRVVAAAVDSTSGTVVPIDEHGTALTPAIMHNDTRASSQADEVAAITGHPVSATFALPKLLWLKQESPAVFRRARRFVHATDFVVGKLTGEFGVSDSFNVLKMGYDLRQDRWPEFIEAKLGVPLRMLPKVVEPGEVIGAVSAKASHETGLSKGTPVVAGATDSNAAFFASGAAGEGEWNSTLGTSLAFKGVSRSYISDALGRVYCHRHPEHLWLPGSASNTGADCIRTVFGSDYEALEGEVAAHLPSRLLVYPLVRKGERFPFIDHDAAGFVLGHPASELALLAGYMEGVAYVERWGYEVFESLGAPVRDTLYATGGGARSETWLQVRANVLDRRIARASVAESAMGAAIIAASRTMYDSVSEASGSMVRLDLEIEPQPQAVDVYRDLYDRFRNEMCKRGYGQSPSRPFSSQAQASTP
jgi:sugar (pentulose or hexulose) kinase